MFDTGYFNLGYLDTLSYKDTAIHRLDPRAKLITTILFIIAVVSFPKYEITGLLPFISFPVLLFALADIPVRFIMKKVLLVSSFAFFIGIFNPIIEKRIVTTFLGVSLSGGWISFLSIMMKFFLTISAALLLIATTSFPGICYALQRLGVPSIFVSQLLFLYRYIFVLTEETMRVVRARDMRSFGKRGRGIKSFISLLGTLFLRTVEKAERIYQSMLSRGFTGELRSTREYSLTAGDVAFVILSASMFYIFRSFDVIVAAGNFAMAVFKGI